jgi:hypothetical protein
MPENMAAPPLPSAVRPPASERHAITLRAEGTLKYACRPRPGMSGAYGWVLDAPDAALLHWTGVHVGRYSAGPTLRYRDGSSVTLKLVAASPDEPGKMPIHLYRAAGHGGAGEFADVTYVQRLNAVGREPDAACTASNAASAARQAFSADFLFYKAP